MPPLTADQINSFIERIGQVFDIPLFTETDASRLLTKANESVKWETEIKELLTNAGFPDSFDQINLSIMPIQTLAPLFALHNLQLRKENLTTLIDKITSSSSRIPDCMSYTAPFPRDFYILDEVRTLRPEYLAGTWFNRQNKAFKVNMEYDWVYRKGSMPSTPMRISLFASTGDHIWDFISEVHVHRTAMMEFTRPMDGWIEAPTVGIWRYLAADDPLNFVDRMVKSEGGRVIVNLNNGTGGCATFEGVKNHDVTAAAARLLYKFSGPGYCARGDGKVVIKLTESASRAAMTDSSTFPAGRTLVSDRNKFPF